jgi:hypothetical protein
MKTISRIIMIVLVAAVVAGAFSLAVNNGSIASGSNASEQPPVVTSNGQSTNRPIARFEGGDRDEGSITRGFAGVVGTLAKLAGITIIVLLLQKGFSQLEGRKLISAQR